MRQTALGGALAAAVLWLTPGKGLAQQNKEIGEKEVANEQ
jgi:hypothetical protein